MGSYEELKMLQKLPLEVKIKKSQQRIREWVNHFGLKKYIHKFFRREGQHRSAGCCEKDIPRHNCNILQYRFGIPRNCIICKKD